MTDQGKTLDEEYIYYRDLAKLKDKDLFQYLMVMEEKMETLKKTFGENSKYRMERYKKYAVGFAKNILAIDKRYEKRRDGND